VRRASLRLVHGLMNIARMPTYHLEGLEKLVLAYIDHNTSAIGAVLNPP